MSINFFVIKDDFLDLYKGESANAINKLFEIFNTKFLKVSDTNLSYRQSSYINENILKDDRKNKKGWRTFSLKEVIYLSIVLDLRKFGLKDNQLKNLKSSFFGREEYRILSDIVFLYVLFGVSVQLLIDEKFNIYFISSDYYLDIQQQQKISITLNFNEYVNDYIENVFADKIEYKKLVEMLKEFLVEPKSKKMIDLLKKYSYEEFSGRQKNIDGKRETIITGKERRLCNIKEISQLMNEEYTKVTKEKKVAKDKFKVLIEKSHKI